MEGNELGGQIDYNICKRDTFISEHEVCHLTEIAFKYIALLDQCNKKYQKKKKLKKEYKLGRLGDSGG